MKCLVFDIKGDYGHFKKYYTTSSPLTFSIPPRTTVSGMIGALIGLDKEEYLKYFSKEDAKIAIQINSPINKTRISYNLINTKTAKMYSKIKDRTQVTFELLKNPSFRIYFSHSDINLYNKVKTFLEEGKNYYTLSMGLSEFISEFDYISEIDLKEINNNEFDYIDTAINFNENLKIDFESEKEYFKDTMPNEMDVNRVVTDYAKVLFETNGKPIKCNTHYYLGSGGEKIVFL